MKRMAIFIWLEIVISPMAALSQSASQSQKDELNSITQRVRGGDNNALYEVATMPASVAVPYLYSWTRPLNDEQRDAVVGEVLREVPGAVEYVNQDMPKPLAAGGFPGEDFEILGTNCDTRGGGNGCTLPV